MQAVDMYSSESNQITSESMSANVPLEPFSYFKSQRRPWSPISTTDVKAARTEKLRKEGLNSSHPQPFHVSSQQQTSRMSSLSGDRSLFPELFETESRSLAKKLAQCPEYANSKTETLSNMLINSHKLANSGKCRDVMESSNNNNSTPSNGKWWVKLSAQSAKPPSQTKSQSMSLTAHMKEPVLGNNTCKNRYDFDYIFGPPPSHVLNCANNNSNSNSSSGNTTQSRPQTQSQQTHSHTHTNNNNNNNSNNVTTPIATSRQTSTVTARQTPGVTARQTRTPNSVLSRTGLSVMDTNTNNNTTNINTNTVRSVTVSDSQSFLNTVKTDTLSLSASQLESLPESWQNSKSVVQWKRTKDFKQSQTSKNDNNNSNNNNSHIKVSSLLNNNNNNNNNNLEMSSKQDTFTDSISSSLPTHFMHDPISQKHGFLIQQNPSKLLREYNYTRAELYSIWIKFKALCALSADTNGISRTMFKRGILRLVVEDDLFVDRVYNLVDEDGSGSIDWSEFLRAINALENGRLEGKCRFFLQAYDLDGDGAICKQDLLTMFANSSLLFKDVEEKKKKKIGDLLSLAHGFFRPCDMPRLKLYQKQVTQFVEESNIDQSELEIAANKTANEVVETFVSQVFKKFGKEEEDDTINLDAIIQYMNENTSDEDVWELFGRSMLTDLGAK